MKEQEFTEEVNCHNPGWEHSARRFAEAGVPFTLVNFSYQRHVEFYNKVSLEFDLQSNFDLENRRASFTKRA
jgi:hypothetical protein